MTFTQSLVTHRYLNADGTPAAGEVVFTLQTAMTNGSVTIMPASRVTSMLSPDGTLSQPLTSTQDPDTFPVNPMPLWRVDEHVAGSSTRTYEVSVPPRGASADLGTLMPFASAVEPGGSN